jgi:hypothetical protein
MLMRGAVMFFVLLSWSLSPPSAASAAPLSLYGPFDQKHYGVRSEPASSPAYRALSAPSNISGIWHTRESSKLR